MPALLLALALASPDGGTELRAVVNPLPALDREARRGLRSDGLEGADVRVRLSLSAAGRVKALSVEEGPSYLHASVERALSRWRFEAPGEPLEIELGVRVGSREPAGASLSSPARRARR